jgi:hypothetical protein
MKKINIPFTTDINGGNNSFKILNESTITKKSTKNSIGILNYVKKLIYKNQSNKSSNNINYIKASTTKKSKK